MKVLITLLALINGLYMLADGLFVMFKRKYIGPEKPGPWANLFYKLNLDVFKFGPVFILFGLLWITWIYSLLTHQSWGYVFGIAISTATLWYLPIGTFFSAVILVILITAKSNLGF